MNENMCTKKRKQLTNVHCQNIEQKNCNVKINFQFLKNLKKEHLKRKSKIKRLKLTKYINNMF